MGAKSLGACSGISQNFKGGESMNHSMTWVKLKKYAEISGDSESAVHARRRAGKWLDGVQCKIVDDNLWINLSEAEKWIEQWGTRKALAA